MILLNSKIASIVLEICLTSMLQPMSSHTGLKNTCPELLALAELESLFNYKAVGQVGERGLFQIRPEMWGEVHPSSVAKQTKKALEMLSYIKTQCRPDADYSHIVCWNVGINKGRLIQKNKPGPYRKKYIKLVKKWKNWYEQETTRNLLFTYLHRTLGTKRVVASETLVQPIFRED